MLTDEVRKFTDDDFRAAVRLLKLTEFNVDLALALVATNSVTDAQMEAAFELLQILDLDYAAAKQLLIVTNSFREVLGLKS